MDANNMRNQDSNEEGNNGDRISLLDSVIPFPQFDTFILFSKLVYSHSKMASNEIDIDLKKYDLLKGWKLLDTHFEPGWTNGYFGAAYIHSDSQRVVIAHRGTVPTNLGCILADINGVILNRNHPQINSACQFVDQVSERCKSYELFITGHSLGGWLAQITTYSLKYLKIGPQSELIPRDDGDEGIHAHAVTIDNPGCRDMLERLKNEYFARYGDNGTIEKLDLVSLLAAPNLINCTNEHVGIIYRFGENLARKRDTLDSHAIVNILERTSLDDINLVKDWPRTFIELSYITEPNGRYEIEENNPRYCKMNVFSPDEQKFLIKCIEISNYNENIAHLFDLKSQKDNKQVDALLRSFRIEGNWIRFKNDIENGTRPQYFESINEEDKKVKKIIASIKLLLARFPHLKTDQGLEIQSLQLEAKKYPPSVESFYIERKLNYEIRISKDVLYLDKQKLGNNIFILDGFHTSTRLDSDHFIDATRQSFDVSCVEKRGKNVHLLNYDSSTDCFMWQKSKGDLSVLRKYIKKDSPTESESKWIERVKEQRLIIISDTAGMGKSTVLTHMTHLIKSNDSHIWVVRVNLNDHADKIREHKKWGHFNKLISDRAVDILMDLMYLKTQTHKDWFNNKLKEGKVIVMLDGFDEISLEFKEQVLALLKGLKESEIKQIWVTTRPFMRQYLEDNLHQFAFILEPFSQNNQIEFLSNYWSNRLNFIYSDLKDIQDLLDSLIKAPKDNQILEKLETELRKPGRIIPNLTDLGKALDLINVLKNNVEHENSQEDYKNLKGLLINPNLEKLRNKDKIEVYANQVLSEMSIPDKDQEFTGIPLQTRMLAEAYQNDCLDYLLDPAETQITIKKNLIDLYEKFIESKFNIYFDEKVKISCSSQAEPIKTRVWEDILKRHQILALYALFNKDDFEKLTGTNSVESKIKEIKDGNEMAGIVDGIVEEKPHFVHRTFAEYFVAQFLVDQIIFNSGPIRQEAVDYLINNILVEPDHKVIRAFMNGIIGKKYSNREVINDEKLYGQRMAELTNENNDGLHVAVKETNVNIVKFIIDCLNSIQHTEFRKEFMNRQDEYRRVPLYYAAESGNLEIFKLLVENGADIKAGGYESSVDITAKKGHISIIKWLIEENRITIDYKNKYQKTLLYFAAQSGNLELVNWLVDQGANINPTENNGSVLEHAAAWHKWNIVRWLFDNGVDFHNQGGEEVFSLHAVSDNQLDLMKLIKEQYKISQKTVNQAFIETAYDGKLEIAKWLVEECAAGIHFNNDEGLYKAIIKNRWNIVRWLTKERGVQSVSVKRIFEDRESFVQHVKDWFKREITRKDKKQIDMHEIDKRLTHHNKAAFLRLIELKRHDIMEWLVDNGLVLNYYVYRYFYNNEVIIDEPEVAKWLEENQFDITKTVNEGKSAILVATKQGELEIAKFLTENNIDINLHSTSNMSTAFCRAVEQNNWDVVEWLTKNEVDFYRREESKYRTEGFKEY